MVNFDLNQIFLRGTFNNQSIINLLSMQRKRISKKIIYHKKVLHVVYICILTFFFTIQTDRRIFFTWIVLYLRQIYVQK